MVIKYHFISQSASGIRHKFQKSELEPDAPISWLVELGNRVFNNWDREQECKED